MTPVAVPRCEGDPERLTGQVRRPNQVFPHVVLSDHSKRIVRTSSGPSSLYAMASSRTSPPRRHRIEVRVTPEQDASIRQAAALEDTTVTSFVLEAVTARAKEVLKEHNTIVLSNQAFDRFLAELDKPPEQVPELVRLFTRQPPLPTG